MNVKKIAKNAISISVTALKNLKESIDDRFENCVQLVLECKGRVVVTGIGKSALVGKKLVATLNSTGTPALFMHAADAVHGDLGMVSEQDIVICISKSGETAELKALLPILKSNSTTTIALTSNNDSYLAKHADGILFTPIKIEADPNNLAPTTSTTAQTAMGDALAIALLSCKGFSAEQFAKFHPGGTLGKQLYLEVDRLVSEGSNPMVLKTASLEQILLEMSAYRLGATVVMESNKILGIITDGDIRRALQKYDSSEIQAQKIMSDSPQSIFANTLAVEALRIMKENKISQLVVTSMDNDYIGILHINDLLKEGFT